MARPTKQGLEYFPFDVGFFGDKDVRILKARYRSDGIVVYVKLLCDIYKEGYYLPVKNWEDYLYIIGEEFQITVDKVEQIITFLHNRAMVRIYKENELTGYDVDAVITSHGIQKRYAAAMKSRRKKGIDEIKRGFWLLTEQEEKEINAFYKCGNNEGFYGNNSDNFRNNPDKSEKNPIKEKESKYKSVNVKHARMREEFLKRFPNVREDPEINDEGIDYTRLMTCFERSAKYLQLKCSLSWIVLNYEKILTGKYDDFNAPMSLSANVQAANDRAERESFYSRRRNAVMNEAEKMYDRAMSSVSFATAERELKKIEIEEAKAELYSPAVLFEIRQKKDKIKNDRVSALSALGLSEFDLLPKWNCERCSDTGYQKDGRVCDCYINEREKGSKRV